VRRHIDHPLIVLNGLGVVFLLGEQVAQIHFDIAKNELLAYYLFGFVKVLLSLFCLVSLKAKRSKAVMIVACEQLFVYFTKSLELPIGLLLPLVSENIFKESTSSYSFFANILDLGLLFLLLRLHLFY